jgi:hypothetical protein
VLTRRPSLLLGLTARYLRAYRHGPGKKCRYRAATGCPISLTVTHHGCTCGMAEPVPRLRFSHGDAPVNDDRCWNMSGGSLTLCLRSVRIEGQTIEGLSGCVCAAKQTGS